MLVCIIQKFGGKQEFSRFYQSNGKLPLPRWKQGNYPVVTIYSNIHIISITVYSKIIPQVVTRNFSINIITNLYPIITNVSINTYMPIYISPFPSLSSAPKENKFHNWIWKHNSPSNHMHFLREYLHQPVPNNYQYGN